MRRRLRSSASRPPPTSPSPSHSPSHSLPQNGSSTVVVPKETLSSLLSALKNQKSQVETLIQERKYLEDYIRRQHKRWHSKNRCLRSQISQLVRREEVEKGVWEAKTELFLELMRRDALFYKDQFEQSEDDLNDFHGYIGTLGKRILELVKKKENKDATNENSFLEDKQQMVVEHMKNVSALLAEKDFIWNQFNKLDEDYSHLRKINHIELEQAYESIENLHITIDNLQSSISEKDKMISEKNETNTRLRTDLNEARENLTKLEIEFEKLRRINEMKDVTIRYKSYQSNSPLIDGKTSRSSSGILRMNTTSMGKKGLEPSSSDNGNIRVLCNQKICPCKASSGSKASSAPHTLQRCSTSIGVVSYPSPERPKLFSSRLKVPKLKKSTTQALTGSTD